MQRYDIHAEKDMACSWTVEEESETGEWIKADEALAREALLEGEWRNVLGIAGDAVKKIEALSARIAELEAVALNALYHHQGANSPVGQPIRKTIGIGRYAPLTPTQLEIARSVSGLGHE